MLARPEQFFLQELAGGIGRYAGAAFAKSSSGITVEASGPSGFVMTMMIDDGAYILRFDEWEETFESKMYAEALFHAALKGQVRLRIDTLGGRRWRWTAQRLRSDGNWVAESTIGHPVWRMWGEAGVVYLQNDYVAVS